MPPVPPIPVINLEVDPKEEDPEENPEEEEEDPEEDPKEEEVDPMEDEDHVGVADDRVAAPEIEPMAEELPVPQGARPVVVRT